MRDKAHIMRVIEAIAIPENTAINPAHQSVKFCVRYLCRASARLQISSLSFALCWTVLFALFSGIAIVHRFRNNYTTYLPANLIAQLGYLFDK